MHAYEAPEERSPRRGRAPQGTLGPPPRMPIAAPRCPTRPPQQQSPALKGPMAEREGFEPSVPLRVHMISTHAPSASRSPLRGPRAHRREAPRGTDAELHRNPMELGGESGIRTHGTLAGTPD